MGFLNKILGKKERNEAPILPAPYSHVVLLPRWESVEEMGNEEKIAGYTCESCQESFSPEAGRELQKLEADRFRREMTRGAES